MPATVVPLAASEWGSLTLAELMLLEGATRVLFEDPAHPLADRLRAAGVEVAASPTTPLGDGDVLVAIPGSALSLEMARTGASVSSGASSAPDALTAAYGATSVRTGSARVGELILVMARLRSDDGCPWDREQDHRSLIVHLLEETYEVIDAVESGRSPADLQEELGDLLLQVVFHAQMAADAGTFDIAAVAAGIVDKLVRRHPHVFGDAEVTGADDVVSRWEQIKAREKARDDRPEGPFADIPSVLPALIEAYKTQKRAAGLGFTAAAGTARDRVAAALGHKGASPDDEEVGRALFWLVALARAAGVDPEGALRRATASFRRETTESQMPG